MSTYQLVFLSHSAVAKLQSALLASVSAVGNNLSSLVSFWHANFPCQDMRKYAVELGSTEPDKGEVQKSVVFLYL
jgi:hypothetical protein